MDHTAAPPPADDADPIDKIGDLAAAAGIRAINVLAWRDLDDPEAGGSEVHIHEVMRRWSDAGVAVTMRTSFAPGQPAIAGRGGYRVIRRAGRYLVFPRAAASEALRRHGPADALVEVWNGVPFLSPLWSPGRPRLTILHHLHTELWSSVLAPRPARVGDLVERRLAPLAYRGTPVATLSESSRRDLLARTWFKHDQIHVVPPGIEPRFVPAPALIEPSPLVVAVG
ncbi:MAG TPA: glycosyltransferase family 4 protein, partial [Acidimicrobiales bacterium]